MKQFVLSLFVSAAAVAGLAQTPPKPAAPTASAKPAAAASGVKLPPGVPPAHAIVKTAFSLRYQDIRIGKGADAEPNKNYKVNYTGWLAADGHKFDSSYDHKTPVMGKDGKPELDADGKPKMNDGEPISFPQGFGRVIPGFDQGFTGMKIGGKRRLFIPWQLAYGARGRPGPNAANPGIPPKADLIFDIELVDVSEMPTPQARPGMGNGPNGQPMRMIPHAPAPGGSGTPATPPPATTAPTTSPATPPATTPPPASTTTAQPPASTTATPPPTEKPRL
jgi:peptidylprolyl isomerase